MLIFFWQYLNYKALITSVVKCVQISGWYCTSGQEWERSKQTGADTRQKAKGQQRGPAALHFDLVLFISVSTHSNNNCAKLNFSTPMRDTMLKHHCPLVKILSNEHFTDHCGRQRVALRWSINLHGEAEQRPDLPLTLSLSQSSPNIRSSHKQLSFSSSRTPPCPLLILSSCRPRFRQAHRMFIDTPLWGHSFSVSGFKGRGEEEWWGSAREWEGQGRG